MKIKTLIFFCFMVASALLVACTKDSTVPCVKESIDQMKSSCLQGHVSQYNYNGQLVYYVAIDQCCDFGNTLYDANCNILCESGGFGGLQCPDSIQNSLADEVVIFVNP
jgi:hypothetical protein